MPSTGPLATLLRTTGDDDLVHGLTLRGIGISGHSISGIRDFYDLAELLLSTDSLQHCLTRLERRSLRAIYGLSEHAMSPADVSDTFGLDAAEHERLSALFLTRESEGSITVWPEVGERLAEWASLGLPEPDDDSPEPGELRSATEASATIDNLATERAFTATTAIAELLFDLAHEPLRLLATGAVGKPGTRRLADILRVDEAVVSSLLDIAENAGLTRRSNGRLTPSEHHRVWLEKRTAERWGLLADTWAEAHWSGIRHRLGARHFAEKTGLADWLGWNYPGGAAWLPRSSEARLREAELLGITAHAVVSSAGALLLTREVDAAETLLSAALPAPIDRLYLQHDLTAVAPGPLESPLDTRLRGMADVDGHSIASRYRFTSASITRALSNGETAASILDFLASVTLSGMPQPLEYLITETSERHGLLRVGPLPTGEPQPLAYIRSDDPVLLRTVLVDRALAVLRLRPRDNDHLVSACDRDELYAMLFAAKYPVVAEDAQGNILTTLPMAASARTPNRTVSTPPTPPLRVLVSRLRVADADTPEDSSEAWLARQLDTAIRTRSTVTVSVRMPNGNVVDYRLEPASLSKGRLRARDPLSEIERTLPLSSIAAVTST